MSETDYSTTDGIPVRRLDGRTIGKVSQGRFIKVVKASMHQLKTPPGWGLDLQSLTDAERFGARIVEIHDTESDVVYSASVERIRSSKGFAFDRGFGPQICLPLQSWTFHRPGEPQQLVLALGGQL